MATEVLYPHSPDDGFLDWGINSGAVNRYDAINEGTQQPDVTDYIEKKNAGNASFKDLYESGTFYDNVKAYYKPVRVNFGPMNLRPDDTGMVLNTYAAKIYNGYYGSPDWGIGSFISEGDFLLNYWTLDNNTTGLVSKITPGIAWSTALSPEAATFNTGKQGNAAIFSGESYLSGGMTDELNELYRFDSSKSFGGWIYNTKSSGDALLFSLGSGSPRNTCCTLKLVDGGSMEFTIYRQYTENGVLLGTPIQTLSTTAPELNRWSFVICTIDTNNRQLKISINGGDYITNEFSNSYVNSVINFDFDRMYLGGNPALTYTGTSASQSIVATYFSGKIDEWAMWSIALPIEQVIAYYNAGVGTTYPLDDFEDRKVTTLYDNNGLEIASIPASTISSSGDLIPVNSFDPALYNFPMSDISNRESIWDNYDFSNVYADIQFFTERKYTGVQFTETGFTSGSNAISTGGGDIWQDVNEVFSQDGSYAWVETLSDSADLHITGFGFDFPSDSQIIEVELKMTTYYNVAPSETYDTTLSLWLTDNTGTKIGDAQTNWTIIDEVVSNNDSSSLVTWGATLTPSIINNDPDVAGDEFFGVIAKITSTGGVFTPLYFGIDNIELNIKYSILKPLDPSISAAIFTLDIDNQGKYISHNNIPLKIHNTIEPEDTTLYTVSSETSSGEVPLITKGNLTSTDDLELFIHGLTDASGDTPLFVEGGKYSDTTLFIEGDETESTGIPLHTIGGIYDNSSIDLIIANKDAYFDCPLFISGHGSITGDTPLNIFGKDLETDSAPLFISGQISYDDSGNMNMFINGYGGDTTGSTELNIWGANNPALRDTVPLFIKDDNSGETNSNMNLFIKAPDMADITSNMNLFLNSDIPSIGESASFFLANEYVTDSGETTFFISAPGTTDGAYPSNSNVNLFMGRENQHNWLGMPMYMLVASGDDENIPLYINSVSDITGSLTFTFPNVNTPDSGDISLYTHGF